MNATAIYMQDESPYPGSVLKFDSVCCVASVTTSPLLWPLTGCASAVKRVLFNLKCLVVTIHLVKFHWHHANPAAG